MKIFLPLVVLAMSACATLKPQGQPVTADSSASVTPGVVQITGEQLRQTGRPDVADALKMVSPIFH